jgi:hypothetical protein
MLTERKSLRFDQCSSLEIILGQLVDIYGGSRNGNFESNQAVRGTVECRDSEIKILMLKKRKELSCGQHSTIWLYRPGVSLEYWSMCRKVPRHAESA